MTLAPKTTDPFQPTDKAPGHRVLSLHRVHVIDDRGGAEPVAPVAGPAPVMLRQHGRALVDWGWVPLLALGLGMIAVWAFA